MSKKYNQFTVAFVVAIAKSLIFLLRAVSLGGTTLPGRIAIALKKDIMQVLAQNLDKIIAVTGTNGKTTTCRIIGRVLSESDIPYFTNKSGANLLSGILSTLIENCRLDGTFDQKTALFEIDEAAFSKVTDFFSPNYIVITNFFRDQLDRYGELYTTVGNVKRGVEKTADPILIVNGDDSLSASISKDTGKRTVFFGFHPTTAQDVASDSSTDAAFCVYCKARYEYRFRTFGHLGAFECPQCGFSHPSPQVGVSEIHAVTTNHSDITISFSKTGQTDSQTAFASLALKNVDKLPLVYSSFDKTVSEEAAKESLECPLDKDHCQPITENSLDESTQLSLAEIRENLEKPDQPLDTGGTIQIQCRINLPGLYNIYNALGASALSYAMNLSPDSLKEALQTFECGFGRMETISSEGKHMKLILVKNPTGFNQVLNFLLTERKPTNIAFLINDNIADGTDISWLWDVEFEKLEKFQEHVKTFFCAGKRADDMALRLKYSGVYPHKIKLVEDYSSLVDLGLSQTEKDHHFYILPTYTAMLEIRSILKKKFNLKEFWK